MQLTSNVYVFRHCLASETLRTHEWKANRFAWSGGMPGGILYIARKKKENIDAKYIW